MESSNNSDAAPTSALDSLNHTELYQVCRRVGLEVPVNATREHLIAYLYGAAEPPSASNVPDKLRRGLIAFIYDHWSVLQPQLKCPAKNLRHPTNADPKPCFQCGDTQVIACYVEHKQLEHTIRKYIKE